LNENGQRVSGNQTFGANLSDSALAYAKEAEPWPTPDAGAFGAGSDPAATDARRSRIKAELKNGNGFGLTVGHAAMAFASDTDSDRLVRRGDGAEEAEGADLWPVTLNAPGRVAKLKAIGNAVVPAWVVAGPFAEILQCEAGR